MRRLFASALLALGLIAVVAAGCGRLTGKLTGVRKGNTPPHTVLFVEGDLDPVNHVVHLFWFGSDPDGTVQGFEWKLLNPHAPGDTAWRFTRANDSIFVVRDTLETIQTVFSVRAIDNTGVRDPSPPVQVFRFKNQAPTVRLVQKPLATDTTFASLTVTWTAGDVDGDANRLLFLVWLDGRRSTPDTTRGTTFTVPSDRFPVNGVMTTGRRKLFVQSIDDGGRASAIDSVSWVVRRPVLGTRARLLIVDDGPDSASAGTTINTRYDTLYSNPAGRLGLSANEYSILRLDKTQPFKSAKDLEQTFKLFDSVIWYRGNRINVSNLLSTYQAGIEEYLNTSGKNFFVEGLYMFSAPGLTGNLSESFAETYLHARLARQFSTTVLDSVMGFGNTNPSRFVQRLDVGGVSAGAPDGIGRDPFTYNGIFAVNSNADGGGLRQFVTRDSNEVALWAQPGTLSPANVDRVPVGLTVLQPGGGRAVVLTTALPVVFPGLGGVSAFVTNLYRHFGLDR